MTVSLTYDGTLSRVRINVDSLAGPTATVERSSSGVTWQAVRGGTEMTVTAGEIDLDDYEFAPGVVNHYRIDGQTEDITPVLDSVWIKSLARPFLNRPVTVVGVSDITRPSRTGTFPVVGRTFPVAVTDVRTGRQWSIDVLTPTLSEARDLDLILAAGDIMLIHTPPDVIVPGGYVSVGDIATRRTRPRGTRQVFNLPLIEVAAPGPDVVGATITRQGLLGLYGTWADLLADQPTWADVLQLIGSPGDVIVP